MSIEAKNESRWDPVVFETLHVREEGAVLLVEIAAPPMNLLGPELVRDLVSLIQRAEADNAVQVLVFKSADPDYFISHVDLTRTKEIRQEAVRLTGEASIWFLFRQLSASRLVTIAQIEGRARDVGSEFVLACDMRLPHVSQRSSVNSSRRSVRSPAQAPPNTSRASWAAPGRSKSCWARRTMTRSWLNDTDGSIERCPLPSSASSSDCSLIGSPGFRPLVGWW